MIPLSHNTDKIYLILVFKNFIYVPSLVCFCVGTFRICQGVAWIFFTYGPLLRRPVRMLLPNPHVCYLFFLVSFSPWASGDTRRRGRWRPLLIAMPAALPVRLSFVSRRGSRPGPGGERRLPPSGPAPPPAFPQVPLGGRDASVTLCSLPVAHRRVLVLHLFYRPFWYCTIS